MATAFNVEQNKLSILDGLLIRLFNEQKIKLKIGFKDVVEIPQDLKSKIEGTLNVRASLLSKTSKQKNILSTDKQTETLIGNFYFYINQLDLAKSFYEKASKMDPKFIEPILNKGNLFAKQGNHQEAVSCYDKVLSITP
jgi:tetratricopeptide (TPR) repeat protein